MEGEIAIDLSSEPQTDSGDLAKPQCSENPFEIESVDDEFEGVQENGKENAEETSNSKAEDTIIDQIGPRMNISAKYFEHPELVTEHYTAYMKATVPGMSDDISCKLDAYFGLTLTIEDSSPIMLEIGDCFTYLIFLGCVKMRKNTSSTMQLVFIRSSWLEKCPPNSEGIGAMRNSDRKKFLCYNKYIFFVT